MGARASTLSRDDIEELSEISSFTPQQIIRLYKRFRRLDRDDLGLLNTDDILNAIPELAMNPLAERICAVLDPHDTETIHFRQFCEVLGAFSPHASRERKLMFAFKIYDVNDDGFITADEMLTVLQMLAGTGGPDSLSLAQLTALAEQTVKDADLDGDGRVSFQEFVQSSQGIDVHEKFTIIF
ncbi:hypothetical protein H696_01507 [Fonticula alba]|uniref:EF-hand domain-containing protein n=1 Tax=Fonticula alba TaxID=691883 RepID=A0A058ZCG2_FONAL|nr:hypothetical protein H696_01507 [Fonticula alba]KCV72100.1 hypothetical protein H696_01507 [Fonticula alba]|eukprot:XP_009493678.1 hypothetical protein H696_01507 [Fonticula alba]